MFREVLMAFCYLWGAKNVTEIQTGFFARMGPRLLSSPDGSGNATAVLTADGEAPRCERQAHHGPAGSIARLEERGYDTAKARTALAHLEEMRKLHIADRDRLSRALRELGE
jgi:hypothetical protein